MGTGFSITYCQLELRLHLMLESVCLVSKSSPDSATYQLCHLPPQCPAGSAGECQADLQVHPRCRHGRPPQRRGQRQHQHQQ